MAGEVLTAFPVLLFLKHQCLRCVTMLTVALHFPDFTRQLSKRCPVAPWVPDGQP